MNTQKYAACYERRICAIGNSPEDAAQKAFDNCEWPAKECFDIHPITDEAAAFGLRYGFDNGRERYNMTNGLITRVH